ncbi:unnamed protein product [Alopecurus aequalis]
MGKGRGMAAKGKKRSRNGLPPEAKAGDGPEKAGGGKDGPEKAGGGGRFFCCYLLRSLCPSSKSRTYIGFTVNPRRRIRQHNGEIRCGAWRTKRGRPWEMVLCIHGFPTNVAALQFEWAWQHPTESLAVRKAAAGFKSLGGIGNKIKIAYTMLNLPSWENLNLTVNFFSTKNTKFTAGCPALPCHMKTVVSPMEDLPCYDKGISSEEDKEPREDEEPDDETVGGETSDHGFQPLDLETGAASGESDIDELAPVEWNGVFGSRISESSSPQPVEEEPGIADCDAGYSSDRNPIDDLGYMDWSRSPIADLGYMEWSRSPIADLGYMEWGGIHETSELHESRTSPRCSASDDVSRGSVDCVSGQASPGSKAGPDDLFHKTDVVDLVTPVGRFARDCSRAASICPKIIDLTNSPIVIEL